jgi:hypothetical protein
MKTLLLILLVAIQGIAYADDKSQIADDKSQIGRYQLLYAITQTVNPTGAYDEKRVWKIDTVTGQVWQYTSTSNGKGQARENFYPVETIKP